MKGILALAVIIAIGLVIWAVVLPWLDTFVETLGGEPETTRPDELPLIPETELPPLIDISQLEQETFNLINQERRGLYLAPVSWDEQVAQVARRHSEDMAQNNFFAHQNLQGKDVGNRLSEAGIRYSSCGEILFKQSIIESETTTWISGIPITSRDYKTQTELAQIAVSGWMQSSGHRAIILTPGFSKVGVGISSNGDWYYFTGVFVG